MDPAQLTMAAQQADATLAAQTTDQSLQAEIAQSRPDLWASLAANPSVYPDLLAWLFSTGDATVLAILQARGYSPGATATSAASEATAAEPADEVTDEATDEAASAADASDSGTSTDESEPSPEDEGEGEGQDAEESKDSDDADDSSDESEAGEPDDSEKPEESEDPSAEESEEPAVDTGDTEEAEDAEGTGPDAGDAEDAENTENTEGTGRDAEEHPSDSDEAEPSVDESAGVESPDEDEGSDEDSENGPEDAVAVTAAEGTGSDSEPDTETVSETVSEETISDGDSAEPVGDEVEDEPEGGTEDDAEAGAEPETEVVAEDPSADGAASSGEEAASSGEEPAGQTENIPPVEDTAVFASAGVAQAGASPQSAAPAEGSAAPAVDSAESVAMPVAPPPSAEDIAAWAETPSGAPSGFSAAQPAVELDMFGPQMMAQMPPPQQKQPAKSSSGRLIAIIVVLLLVIVGGGGLWAGSHFANKDKSEDTSQNKADSDGGEDGKQNGQADAAATSTAAALPSGAVKACSSMPTFTITSVEDGQGELKVHGNMATSCAEGDFLAGSSSQVLVYSSTSPTGGADVDHLVASGTFDLSSDPLIIPNGGRAVTLRFGEQHYFRTAKDLDLKSLKINPTFDRGSRPSVTSGSSANSPMTIASSTSSNVNQEQQDEQAAGEALRWQASHDRSLVMSKYLGKWTPQLSSKKDGLFADGQTWTNRMILAEFLKTRQAHPDAALVYSNDWSVFDSEGGWWVTLSGELYATADEANAWCDAQGYDAEHCLAKRMESSGPAQGTTKSR